MLRKSFITFSVLIVAFVFLSCGGGGTIDKVCSAGATKVFKECNKSNSTDVQTIIDTFAGFGITITEAEVQSSTETSLKNDCVTDLKEAQVEITSEAADAFIAGLNSLSTCEEVAAYINSGVNSL